MRLDRRWILAHIPHQGPMCLLDEVLNWDAAQIRCASRTHRMIDNPLRAHGRLGSACGIEYAAQTMAVHGALLASVSGNTAPAGYLASVRGVQFSVDQLDDIDSDLITGVERVASDAGTALYQFVVSAKGLALVTGRAAISFSDPR